MVFKALIRETFLQKVPVFAPKSRKNDMDFHHWSRNGANFQNTDFFKNI
jgi:hypothetical protein